MIYTFLDFFRSWTGKVFLLCVLAVWALLAFANKETQAQSEHDLKKSKLPKIPEASLWDEAGDDNNDMDGNTEFTAAETNLGFRPLILRKSEDVEPVREKLEKPFKVDVPVESAEEFTPLPRLILSQRKTSSIVAPRPQVFKQAQNVAENSQNAPGFKEGDLLHCQLLSSVTSEHVGGEAFARTTQALVRKGNVVLSSGTMLKGRLERVTKSGRFFFNADWAINGDEGQSAGFKAVVMEKNFDHTTRLLSTGDGMVGLPSVGSSNSSETRNSTRKLAGEVLSAAMRLGQSRVNTVFGEQVPFSVKNAVLEGGQELLSPDLKDSGGGGTQELRTVHAGQGFYLEVKMLR